MHSLDIASEMTNFSNKNSQNFDIRAVVGGIELRHANYSSSSYSNRCFLSRGYRIPMIHAGADIFLDHTI